MEAERLAATSLVESVWLDRRKYEESETRFQETIAQQHAQLEVVVDWNIDKCFVTDVIIYVHVFGRERRLEVTASTRLQN